MEHNNNKMEFNDEEIKLKVPFNLLISGKFIFISIEELILSFNLCFRK